MTAIAISRLSKHDDMNNNEQRREYLDYPYLLSMLIRDENWNTCITNSVSPPITSYCYLSNCNCERLNEIMEMIKLFLHTQQIIGIWSDEFTNNIHLYHPSCPYPVEGVVKQVSNHDIAWKRLCSRRLHAVSLTRVLLGYMLFLFRLCLGQTSIIMIM